MSPRGRPVGPTPEAETLIVRHGPIYDHFAHRWCLKGELLDGGPATTIIDLAHDLSAARIHPAAIPTYSLTLTTTSVAHLATICRTPGRTATFRNAGTTLTVTHADGDITMASATKTHQLTITYRRYTATALAVILGELHDMIPTQQKAAS